MLATGMSIPTPSDHVPRDRWQAAQRWERDFWVNTERARAKYGKDVLRRLLYALGLGSKYRGDDHNFWWKQQFQDYKFLPRQIENAIEVGCGPYTNVRVMLDHCQFGHLFLSDPLARTYSQFRQTFVRDMYAKAACILDDHPLEELPFASNYFDLVVMINVLDHVRDARACMDSVVRITRPGGFLIIGQELSNAEDLIKIEQDEGRVGHPITVDDKWFGTWLDQGFTPEIRKVLPRA